MNFPLHKKLKNGQMIIIREASEKDAHNAIIYSKIVGDESDNLSFSGDEFNKTIEDEIKIFHDHAVAKNEIFLVAYLDGKLVSMADISSSRKKRRQHVGEFGISVMKAYWGLGIGRIMIETMITFCRESGIIKKLNLVANAKNTSAIRLYKSLGFKHEGTLIKDFYVNGEFLDSVCMGMIID